MAKKTILAYLAIVGWVALGWMPQARAGRIALGIDNIQSNYSIQDDPTTAGIDIGCSIEWINASDYVPANNQISANGTFGSLDSGLYKIKPTGLDHFFNPPTYTIGDNSFNIQYADGVVNVPGAGDTFNFVFTLNDKYSQAQALEVVAQLNKLKTGEMDIADAKCSLASSIGGEVVGEDFFQNNPTVYVPNSFPPSFAADLLAVAASWLAEGCEPGSQCYQADWNADEKVNLEDFAQLAVYWQGQ